MSALEVVLRDLIVADLESWITTKIGETISVEKTYFPMTDVEDLQNLHIKVVPVGLLRSRERILRDKSSSEEVPIQIAFQEAVLQTNTDRIDALLALIEDARDNAIEGDFLNTETDQTYTWLRTQPMLDENNLPLSYEHMYRNGIFMSIFTVYYKYLKPGS